jgi:geranylgeranyl diphosphate synthase type I
MSLNTNMAELDAVEALMLELAKPYAPLDEMVHWHLQSGGKRLRARLGLSMANAMGLETAQALGWSAACELMHNATLVHDDVQDGDLLRRGQPTVWHKFGVSQAINVGDLFFMIAFEALEHVPCADSMRWHLSQALARSCARVIRGQSFDVLVAQNPVLTWEHYWEIVDGKTSSFFQLPVEGVLRMQDAPEEETTRLLDVFKLLGRIFQIVDDIVDLFGEKGRDTIGNDIKEGKLSALVIEYCAHKPEQSDWLLSVLRKPRKDTSQEDVEQVKAAFEKAGLPGLLLTRIENAEHEIRESLQHSNANIVPLVDEFLTLIKVAL